MLKILFKLTENDKRVILAILLLVILVFVIIGFIGSIIVRVMKYQGKKLDTMCHDAVVAKVIKDEKHFKRYARMKNRRAFIKESKIIIIVFAINSKESFEQIDFWLNYTKDILGSDNYIFGLVGNKSDLYEEQSISDQEIKQKADELQIKYKITSAATDSIGFKEFLDELLAEYINKYSPQAIDKPKSFKISEDKDEGDNKDKNGKGKKNCC